MTNFPVQVSNSALRTRLSIITLASALCLVMIVSLMIVTDDSEAATSGNTGDCTWSLDGTDLTISGNGNMGDYDWSYTAPWENAGITSVTIEPGVTNIGSHAFCRCHSLASVTIPESVTRIGYYAFGYCSSVRTITIPDSVVYIGDSAFYCSGLESITLSNNLKEINNSAFSGCDNLSSIVLPESTLYVYDYAFKDSGLTSVTLNDSLIHISSYAFANCNLTEVTIPESVTYIGEHAFLGNITRVVNNSFLDITAGSSDYGNIAQNAEAVIGDVESSTVNGLGITYNTNSKVLKITSCGNDVRTISRTVTVDNEEYRVVDMSQGICQGKTKLESVVIPYGWTSINSYEFKGCTALKSVEIPDSVTYIGDESFRGCSSLETVLMSRNVTRIDNYAFMECTALTSIEIPYGVTIIGYSSFNGCSSLTSVDLPDSLTNIGGYAFSGCSSLTSVDLPDSLTNIGEYAFSGCSSLTSVDLPDPSVSMGAYIFSECTSLISIRIPDNTSIIRNGTFAGCSSLRTIELPGSLISIEDYAFSRCIALEALNLPTKLESIGTRAFSDCDTIKHVSIPDGIKELNYTFEGCTKLLDVILPDSIEKIEGTFNGCEYLLTVNTPANLKIIGNNTFQDCSKLIGFDIPDSVHTIGQNAFYNTKISHVEIPDSVTTIGPGAFSNCQSLYSVKLPSNLELIDTGIFYYCRALRSIEIPETVTTIGDGAFQGCDELKTVTILGDVTEIGSYAFSETYRLEHISIPDSVAEMGDYAFAGSGLKEIHLPANLKIIPKYAFYCCPLMFIEFNGETEWIDDMAFNSCGGLENINMPDTVYLLGNKVFSGNYSLKSIYFSTELRYLYADTFSDIGLYDMDGITPIDVLDVTEIAGHTFSGTDCYNLIRDNYTVTTIVDDVLISNARGVVGETVTMYTKVGYTIEWSVSVPIDISNGQFVMPESNVRLIGTSVPNKYPVTVYLSGGTIDNIPEDWEYTDGLYRKNLDYGTPATVVETLFRDAYKAHSDIEWISTSDAVSTYGLELSINWVPKNYEIRWLNEDGSVLYSSMVEYGMLPTYGGDTPVKSPSNYKVFAFNGWDVEPVNVTGAATYTATYVESDRYFDIYADVGGNLTLIRTKYGDIPALPENPSKPPSSYLSYRFERWTPSVQAVTCDTTYTAVFSTLPHTYTVTWQDDEGNILYVSEGLTYGSTPRFDGSVTKEPTAEYSYTFARWTPQIRDVNADATYTAVFDRVRNTYTVTWVDDEGTVLEIDENVDYGTAPSFDGSVPFKYASPAYIYTFDGWDGLTQETTVTGNITFTAVFASTDRYYNISFNVEGVVSTNSQKYGAVIVLPDEPSKEADAQRTYAFSGWIGYTENMTVTSDAVFTATFSSTPRTYPVTWLDEGGNTLAVNEVAYGTMPSYPNGTVTKTPTAEYSYTFARWTPQLREVTGAVSYTAVFTSAVNTYTVNWKDDTGRILEVDENVPYGTIPEYNGDTPVKNSDPYYNYTFIRWDGFDSGMTIVRDTVFTAIFSSSERYYTISFNSEGSITSTLLRYGDLIVLPEQPSKESDGRYTYSFTGWNGYTENMTVTSDAVFTATFSSTPRTYTVIWKDDEGNTLDTVAGLAYGAIPSYTKGVVTKAATDEFTYTFAGWAPQVKAVDSDATYTAVFDRVRNTYTVTWIDDDGTILEIDENVMYGSAPSFDRSIPMKYPTPAFTYTFAGWEGLTAGMTVSGDLIFTAVYVPTERTYTVTFNADGNVTSSIMRFGETIVPPTQPTKEPDNQFTYAFTGWIGYTENMTVTTDVIFTAAFTSTPRTYAVTWLDDMGNILDTTDGLSYGSMPSYTKGAVTKESTAEFSYTFVRWTPQIKAVSKDTTYTAVFSQVVNEYSVTWKNDSGKILEVDEGVQYGTAPEYNGDLPVKNPDARCYYVFAGWNGYTAGMSITKDTEFIASFTYADRYYTVAFSADGNVVKSTSMRYGETIVAPDDPVKQNNDYYTYSFDSWVGYYDGITVTQNMVFEAKFNTQPKDFTISFISEGESFYSYTGTYGSVVKGPELRPMKEADREYQYVFIAWDGFFNGLTKVEGNMTFEAIFSPLRITHLIQFTVDGKVSSVQSLPFGSAINAPADPVKASTPEFDYTFVSWGAYRPGMTVTGPMTFEAVFLSSERTYTISFIANDNSTDFTMHYGDRIVAPTNPVKSSQNDEIKYTFSHWNGFNDGMTVTGDAIFNAIFTMDVENLTVQNTIVLSIDADSLLSLSDSNFKKIMTKIKTDDGSFSLKVHKGKIKFDANSMESFDWDQVGITMDIVNETLSDEQRQIVGDRPVYDINLSNVKGNIHKFMHGNNAGKITLSLRYDLKEGENPDNLSIWYMDGNDLTEKRNCIYYEEDGLGYVQFETEHLSCYAVMYEDSGNDGNKTPIAIGGIAAAVVGIVAVAGVVLFIRRN